MYLFCFEQSLRSFGPVLKGNKAILFVFDDLGSSTALSCSIDNDDRQEFSLRMTVSHPLLIHSFLPSLTHSLTHSLSLCRAELGRYPLCIDIKASIFSYWQRLLHKTDNPLLNEAFCYARRHSQFFDVLKSEQLIRMPSTSNIVNRQHIKNARSSFKKQLRKNYVQNWLKPAVTVLKALEKNLHTNKLKMTTS